MEAVQRSLFRDTIQQRFEDFHAANPAVLRKLAELALDLKGRGHEKVGIGMLFEVLRWKTLLHTADPASDFKLNNNYRSRYARLLMETYPELDGLFDVRDLRAN